MTDERPREGPRPLPDGGDDPPRERDDETPTTPRDDAIGRDDEPQSGEDDVDEHGANEGGDNERRDLDAEWNEAADVDRTGAKAGGSRAGRGERTTDGRSERGDPPHEDTGTAGPPHDGAKSTGPPHDDAKNAGPPHDGAKNAGPPHDDTADRIDPPGDTSQQGPGGDRDQHPPAGGQPDQHRRGGESTSRGQSVDGQSEGHAPAGGGPGQPPEEATVPGGEAPDDRGEGSLLEYAKVFGVGVGLVVVGFVLGTAAIFAIALGLASAGFELTDTTLLFVSLLGLQGIGFPLTAFIYLRYTGRSFGEFIPVRWPSLRELGVVLGATVAAFVLVFLAATIILVAFETEPASNSAGETVAENPGIVPYLLPFVFLFNGPGEELLFRGVIQGRFRETFGAAAAVVLASLTFAPAHVFSLVGSPQAAALTIALLTVPSLVFGAVYEYTDNFVVPALVHSLYNSVLFGLVYLTATGAGAGESGSSLLGEWLALVAHPV